MILTPSPLLPRKDQKSRGGLRRVPSSGSPGSDGGFPARLLAPLSCYPGAPEPQLHYSTTLGSPHALFPSAQTSQGITGPSDPTYKFAS